MNLPLQPNLHHFEARILMWKPTFIITSSFRDNGNSNTLAQAFKEGAESAGNQVEVISLKQNHIAPCIGCCQCQVHGECFMKDKLNEILDKIIASDILVFASPTYYYSVSGTLKNSIDRTFAKFTKIKNKDLYYIGACTLVLLTKEMQNIHLRFKKHMTWKKTFKI